MSPGAHALEHRLACAELVARVGRVTTVRGQAIESEGPSARLGEVCTIERPIGEVLRAEVLGFHEGRTILMPCGVPLGVVPGARVVATGQLPSIPVGAELLGRVIDADGAPLDADGALPPMARRSLQGPVPDALRRARVREPLDTGIRLIDTMLTLAKGQRIGLFAGSGVGKSSLLGALTRGSCASVNVVALVGERSREVREFVEDQLDAAAFQRTVVVVATSGQPASQRLRAAHAATAIAEHFRDEGEDVLLLMDSITRFAQARREVGLAAGEPPTARGYTPSAFAELAPLCERAGMGESRGSITAVYTVLVEGDDLNEPVSDAIRGLLDGHIVLSREIAQAGQYPAIDVLRSVSRLHPIVAAPQDVRAARDLVALWALYERNRPLIEVGAYKSGVHPALDRAVQYAPRLQSFFAQPSGPPVPRGEALCQLQALWASTRSDHAGV